MTEREEALEPCPFCGADVTAQETRDGPVRPIAVMCGECGASSDIYNTVDEAFAAWNRRASSPPPKGGEGWRIVPIKPTPEMYIAGNECLQLVLTSVDSVWSAMLAAAPDGKATPPGEMGAEQPKAASEHLSSENARLREALEKILTAQDSGDEIMVIETARAALSERTE